MSTYALFSTTNKEDIELFARDLISLGFKICSTGGTAHYLRKHDIDVVDVEKLTDFPEILDGRVKTLHPKIHGGILADWSNDAHASTCKKFGIPRIQIICANLYDFQKGTSQKPLNLNEAIEFIDVGGPTMIRAAAKNFKNCLVVTHKSQFNSVVNALKLKNDQELSSLSLKLSAKAFELCSNYDKMIADYFNRANASDDSLSSSSANSFTDCDASNKDKTVLRYGENPQQKAFWLTGPNHRPITQIQGMELSYNNILDLDAAWMLSNELPPKSAVIVKHNNPCGIACANSEVSPTQQNSGNVISEARQCDPTSAFGGILAWNDCFDGSAAESIGDLFLECIIAKSFSEDALRILAKKTKLRLVQASPDLGKKWQQRSALGGILIQESDVMNTNDQPENWELKTGVDKRSEHNFAREMSCTWTSCKFVKSNAIVLWKNGKSIGIGAGQMSRVDSAKLAIERALRFFGEKELKDSILASDAFLPFADTVDIAARHHITTIIQPGGSIRDHESIDAAQKYNISMYFTSLRHFRH